MCQIIALKTTKKKFKKAFLKHNEDTLIPIALSLGKKGGDYYSGAVIGKHKTALYSSKYFANIQNDLFNFISKSFKNNEEIQLLFFSRQQPEMEEEVVQEQPYFIEPNGKNPGTILAIHGTISNDKELAKQLEVNIGADTEIFMYLNQNDWDKAEGCYALLGIRTDGVILREHGLKIWSSHFAVGNFYLGEIFATEPLEWVKPKADMVEQPPARQILFASFSGGMDISLSVYDALKKNNYQRLVLNYFAWGSKAQKMEEESLEKFKDFYSSSFPSTKVEIFVWNAEKYFSEYFDLNEAPMPKIFNKNESSKADAAETESPLSYVPYRNTQFAILLASYAEAKELSNVDFLFGLNLSEGMVFMDNSEGWLEAINQTVQLGGKDPKITRTYQVIAPYFPETKTNMLRAFQKDHGVAILKQLLLISKSCYYPDKNGRPCGKCGSCILREKALKNLNHNKKEKE